MSSLPENFKKDVIETSYRKPVLVDFWAPWCAPCRIVGPVLEKLARESNGAWRLVKINTDVNPELSMHYGIRGIPAIKLFMQGRVAGEFIGAQPEHAIRRWLEEALQAQTN